MKLTFLCYILPATRPLCVLPVERIRCVPLISPLFVASVMFPLLMPDGVNIDKLLPFCFARSRHSCHLEAQGKSKA
jgi:hypothetical protein